MECLSSLSGSGYEGAFGVGEEVFLGSSLLVASKLNFSACIERRIERREIRIGGPRIVLVVASRRHKSTLNYVKGSTIVSPGLSHLTGRKALFMGKCSTSPDDAPTHTKLLANVSP